ncbi:MAG: NAD(+) synthase [candidate division Zixibacteria bacterium RBG_16_43_9]|nr:MAG: NAD(+) synthase [candidate division Zixibacteria bacterium RBG_16_43_9]
MDFHKNILDINSEKECERICEFIKEQVFTHFRREGAVVGISGGIDSALTSALSVRALGKDKVLGVFLPEKESNPISLTYGELLAKKLGIRTEKVDLTQALESLGCYKKRDEVIKKISPAYDSSYKIKIGLPQDLLERDRINYFSLKMINPKGEEKSFRLSKEGLLGIVAATDMKQRSRMIQLYYYAEKYNYMVIGTTNLSEYAQGFYVKFGDGGVDLEPIAHLYKTQVYQLAKFLDIPEEIIKRVPSPDTFSAVVSDQEFFFCMPYDLLDLLLYAQENKIPLSKVSQVLNLSEEQITRAYRDFDQKRKASIHLNQNAPNLL